MVIIFIILAVYLFAAGDHKFSTHIHNEGLEFPFVFCPGARSNGKLLYSIAEKQLYRQNSSSKERNIRYVCVIPFCTVSLIWKNGALNKPKPSIHQHITQENVYAQHCFDGKVKAEIKASCAGIRDIFLHELNK